MTRLVLAFARADGDERRGDNLAFMPQTDQLPVQSIATRSGLVDEAQALAPDDSRWASVAMTSGRFAKTPSSRTSPRRSPSSTATATVALWTSSPMKMVTFMRSVPHAWGSASARPTQPSNGACCGTGRLAPQTAIIQSRP
jgi:hypothetical protein